MSVDAPPRPRARRGGLLTGPVARRCGIAALQLAVASVGVFALTTALPGNTAEIVLGPDATREQVATLRAELGLDRPAWERFGEWVAGLLTGDPGTSLVTGRPVAVEIVERLQGTLQLGGLVLAVLLPAAVGLGLLCGRRAGSGSDRSLTSLMSIAQAAPEFALGLLLVALFSLQLGLLPATGGGGGLVTPAVLVLPVAVLVAHQLGQLARQVRAGVAQADASSHVAHLRRLGLPESVVLTRHVLPGGLLPSVQQLARVVDALLGGVVVVESLFALPGVGEGFVAAVQTRDLPLIQAYVILFALTTILVNLAADLVSMRLSPYRTVLS